MRFPRLPADAPAVLVVDEGFIGSLHTAIGLRKAGMRVVLLGAVGGDSSYRADGFAARTCPVPGDDTFAERVDAVRRSECCHLVYATTEPTMLALHGRIAPLHPSLDAVQLRLIADKRAMSAHAAAHGVPVPRELPLADDDAAAAAADALGLPLVVKTDRGRGGDGTRILANAAEIAAFAARARAAGRNPSAQPLVRGITYLAGGLFAAGETLGFFGCEKVVQHPAATGPAVHTRSVDEPRLRELATTMMRSLEWTGLASMDFIRDASGEFLFLEVNPRPWGSIAAAGEAGLDLFAPLARMLAGKAPGACGVARAGVETHVLPLYLLSPAYHDARLARRVWTDLRSEQGAPFRDPAFLRHVLFRLHRVKRNWRAV